MIKFRTICNELSFYLERTIMIKNNFDKHAERIVMTTYLSIFTLFTLVVLTHLLKGKTWEELSVYVMISLLLSLFSSIFLIPKVNDKYLYFENILFLYIYLFLFFLFLMMILEATVPIITELLNSKYFSKLFDIK